MSYLQTILQRNQDWIAESLAQDPQFFQKHSQGQSPQILWLGCSDSRVSPEDITGSGKGELFVHRNIANLVTANDFNFLSVLEYALVHLHVKHIVVCGHYGCGGVKAAMTGGDFGLINHWIQPIKDTLRFYQNELDTHSEKQDQLNRLIELNAIEQLAHLGQMQVVRNRWANGPELALHAWVYDLETGKLKVLAQDIDNEEDLSQICKFERLHKKA